MFINRFAEFQEVIKDIKRNKKVHINICPETLPFLFVRHFVFFQKQGRTPNFPESFTALIYSFSKKKKKGFSRKCYKMMIMFLRNLTLQTLNGRPLKYFLNYKLIV